jgi:hypothetical protein
MGRRLEETQQTMLKEKTKKAEIETTIQRKKGNCRTMKRQQKLEEIAKEKCKLLEAAKIEV